MSSLPAERTTSPYRVPLAIGIVVLSIVLPVAVACWSVLSAMRDKGIAGAPSQVVRYYWGSVKNGELWHAEMRVPSNLSVPLIESRILRLDLESGVEHDTGLKTPEFGRPLWMNGTLHFVTETAIYRQEGNEFSKLATLPPPESLHSAVFLWEGQLTMIRQADEGGFRLVHVLDGEWIDGRPILLPEANRVWHDDQQRGRRVLLPLASRQPVSTRTAKPFLVVEVVEFREQHHLMISDRNHFSAFRTGFEFADEPYEGVSALAPENAPQDVSGWEPIGPAQANGARSWMGMTSSREGLLFLSWNEPMKVARRRPEGTWEWFDFPRDGERRGVYWFASDPADAHAYFIGADPLWGSAEVRRIEGHTVHRPHVLVAGGEREYHVRWKRLGVCLLFAWGLHVALLIGGAAWLTRGAARAEYEIGIQRVTLAPLWRRALATGVDVALLAIAVLCFERFLVAVVGIPRTGSDEQARAHNLFVVLFVVEQALHSAFSRMPISWRGPGFQFAMTSPITSSPEIFALFIALLLVICGAKVFFEGRYGMTPGKWLLGLRTVRTTLHPCGFARALVRNVMYYVDLPLLLTLLPAAISLMFSDHRRGWATVPQTLSSSVPVP
jgi:uncharacterized RDD family membrane protein YckC